MELMADAKSLGLSSLLLDRLLSVFRRYPAIEKVMVYGSRARGDFAPGSDIDLAVFAPGMSPGEFARLWGEIDGLPVALKMDLVHFEALGNEGLKREILEGGRVIYTGGEGSRRSGAPAANF